MSDQTDNLVHLLKPFGLTIEESRIYLLLLAKGSLSVLTISRLLRLGRTKVYRILDRLIAKGLVLQTLKSRGLSFEAQSYHQLDFLIKQKESQLDTLKKSIPMVFEQLAKPDPTHGSPAKVVYYKGKDGLKQVTWNSTKAHGILRVIEMANDMSDFLDQEFSEKVRQEFINQKLTSSRQLTNLVHLKPYTQVSEFALMIQDYRYIDPNIFTIEIEMLIYNQVVAIYQFKDNQVFCIEIYNQPLTRMMQQFYDLLWNQAQPMQKIGEQGEAKVVALI